MKLLLTLLAGILLAPPLFAAADSSFERQRESFRSGGRKINVVTFTPKAPGKYPGVIVLHSSAGTLVGQGELEKFAGQLAARGKVAFVVRYFDRTGTTYAGSGAIDRHAGVWGETVKHAVDFAAAHPRVRAESLGIFGFSLGAFLAVAESSVDPRVDAVVEVSGGIFAGFAPRMRRLPPLLILHGDADRIVPVQRAYELEKRARQLGVRPQMKIYPGANHRLAGAPMNDARARALAFFDRQLDRSAKARR
ncbi:MAG TPA: dienelactone hydrolase family protein, partial [Chthoniobacteraceae bacterium]